MTAYILHRTPDGNMHLFADGALTDDVLGGTCLKIEPHCSANFVWIIAGTTGFRDLFAMALVVNNVLDFDDLVANVPGLVRVVSEQLREMNAPQSLFEFQLCFAGWSRAEGRVKGYVYENSPLSDGPKLKLEPVETYMSPGPQAMESGAMNYDWPAPGLAGEPLQAWAVAAMQAMRKVPVGVYRRNDETHSVIGGHVQHVVVAPGIITSQVIHAWPDIVGQPIDAGATGHPVAPVFTHVVRPARAQAGALAAAPLGFGLGRLGLSCCLGGVRRG